MQGERIPAALALLLAVAAAVVSLNTLLSAPRQREILARQAADLRQIQAQSGRWVREEASQACTLSRAMPETAVTVPPTNKAPPSSRRAHRSWRCSQGGGGSLR